MVFSSTTFLFLFLPVVLGLYYLCRKELRNALLLLASLLFYAWGETFFVFLMLFSSGMNYLLALLVSRTRDRMAGKLAIGLTVIVNLGLLAFFKYGNFFLDNLNTLLGVFGVGPIGFGDIRLPLGISFLDGENIHLPIGISFFTFQAMSYVVDVYRKEAPAQKSPVNVALYIALFPQLIAGPIVRYHDVAKQLVSRVVTLHGFSYGVLRFVVGLGKKVLIANSVAVAADGIFAIPNDQLTPSLAWLGIVCYTLQIYFDFSGYSDMAIGLGHLFGFQFLENFRWPYVAQSIREFWQRWHISLSQWFRDYLYIPLGGNRRSSQRTYFNLVTVFFLCGLWHGASWTFAIWGLYHGLFLVFERAGLGAWLERRTALLRHVYTMSVVMIGWVFFRATTFTQAFALLSAMAGFAQGDGTVHYFSMYWNAELALVMVLGLLGSTPWLPVVAQWASSAAQSRGRLWPCVYGVARGGLVLVSVLIIFLLSAMLLAAQTHNPFIYFRF